MFNLLFCQFGRRIVEKNLLISPEQQHEAPGVTLTAFFPRRRLAAIFNPTSVVGSVASRGIHRGIFSGVRLPPLVSERPSETQHPRHGGHSR